MAETFWKHRGWQLGETFPMKVLACMLRDSTFLKETFDCLDPVYFMRDDFVILSTIVLDYFKLNGKPPHKDDLLILIHDKMKAVDPDGSLNRVGTLSQWVNRVYDIELVDIQLIKDKVRDFGRLQAVARGIQKSIAFLEDTNPNKSGEEAIARVQKTLNDSFQVGTDTKVGSFFNEEAMTLPQTLLADAMYGKDSRVPTGIPSIDKVLEGGPGAGTMNVIMAPPNRGKSTVMAYLGVQASLHFARQALTTGIQKSVVHITCEMTEPDIMAKYASGLTGISLDMLTQNAQYAEIMEQRLKAISPVYVKFYPAGSATVDDIQWYVSNLVTMRGVNVGLIIIDYADLLRGMEDDRFQGMGMIYKQLIAMGHKFGCPVWNGCQINRDEAKKMRHGVTGAAESWKKVEISDNIVILNQTEEEHQKGLMIFGLGKIRRGSRQAGSVNCKIDYGKVDIKQIESNVQTHDHAAPPAVQPDPIQPPAPVASPPMKTLPKINPIDIPDLSIKPNR